jgi:NAD(P)-dependent dehydrogenase (short-subunit alcohol dehydrogenase family)
MNQFQTPFSVKNKNLLVTGAASGIGKATSILLSNLGANLVLADINLEGLEETKRECRNSDKIMHIDLSKAADVEAGINSVVKDSWRLHGFVHLAGKSYISPLKTVTESKCEEIYLLNTYAAIELAKVFSKKNIYAGSTGSIVFVSSVYALVGSAANVGYAMSKSALHGITKSLSIELAPKQIRVNCIAPGFIRTKMKAETQQLFSEEHDELLQKMHPLGVGEAGDIANAIAFLLSDAAKWITGTILSVDGGFTAQ